MKAKVRDFMTAHVETLTVDDSLQDAIRISMQLKIRHIPVLADGALVGILSDRDLKRATPSVLSKDSDSDRQRVFKETRVGLIMTRAPQTIGPDESLRVAVETMLDHKYGALPVVEDDKIVGILSETDVLRAFLGVLEA